MTQVTMRCLLISVWLMLIDVTFGQPFTVADSFSGAPTLVLDNVQLTLSSRLLLDIESLTAKPLHGYLGWLPHNSQLKYTSCAGEDVSSEAICLKYGDRMKLRIMQDNIECPDDKYASTTCHRIEWSHHLNAVMDCFLLGDDHWYGGGERLNQRWPLQNDSRPWHAFITGDPAHHPAGGVLENLWLSSSGYMIFIDRDVPLFLSFNQSNNGKLCLSTSSKKYPYGNEDCKLKNLSYTVCSSHNVKEAYQYAIYRWLNKPADIPDERMIHEPVWSSWARYKTVIDQNKIIDFAKEIKSNNYPSSQMEVDDKWQSCYGSLQFDSTKFPNPKLMVQTLKNMGFRTTLWVHPFCNVECDMFKTGERNGYWIKNTTGKPSIVQWWDGTAGMLDVTNKNATDWFIARLESLKSQYGIDSFKFDAGEVSWLQEEFCFNDTHARCQPNLFTKLYTEMASRMGSMVEVRSAWNSQPYSIFFRMYDKDSNWDYTNGIKTLIPTALHFSLMGYRFILPDMVGGNNYGTNSLPDRELFIRWLQVNVFLPAIQFSITPWEYDTEVNNISLQMVNLHAKYAPYIVQACQDSVKTGAPVIRPLWWHSPDDKITHVIDSQFLVGDNILVAPVLEKEMTVRDIYIPDGQWTDMLKGGVVEGPQTLYGYKAALNELPFFTLRT